MLRTARFFLVCAPLILTLAACASPPPADTASLQAQIAATNQKADQALATARQAVTESQAAAPAAPMARRAPAVTAPRRRPSMLVERVQRALAKDGLYLGMRDGLFGPQTRAAVVQFQRQNGLTPTGRLDRATLEKLKQRNSSQRGHRWPKLPKPTSASAAGLGRLAMAAIAR
jgi:peptidoglycan hydrolase-like protein with peptidoglycan-binding domain